MQRGIPIQVMALTRALSRAKELLAYRFGVILQRIQFVKI